jgi:uroporphyrinogen decarboxylase
MVRELRSWEDGYKREQGMPSVMSHKERFVMAVKHGVPDRVPACPCLSNMIPAKRSGRPFWDIYLNNQPPLWKAYLDAARYFDIDGRLIYGGLAFQFAEADRCRVRSSTEVVSRSPEQWVTRTRQATPYGDLVQETVYQVDNPPTVTVKPIKSLEKDLAAFRCLYPDPTGYDAKLADHMRREAGEDAVFCLTVSYPGFHYFTDVFEGGLEGATFTYMDHPDLMEELRLVIHNNTLRRAEMILDYRPDVLYLGGSGTLTLSTPEWVRQFSLPTIKAVTRMAKEAGVPTMLHACGKARWLVELFAEETDLDCFNPLELPPMGDCNLREVKAAYGHRLSLSGNIHTTSIMLQGTPADVMEACRQAIEDAGKGGGFLLMTGDQTGRDTPEENIFAFVEAAKQYGVY